MYVDGKPWNDKFRVKFIKLPKLGHKVESLCKNKGGRKRTHGGILYRRVI